MKLTQPNVDKLKLPASKTDHIEWDDDMPGFGVRLRSGGSKVWVVQYRAGARQPRQTIGKVAVVGADKARAQAKQTLAKVTLGDDPQAKKVEAQRLAKVTLGSIADLYLEHQSRARLKPKTLYEAARYLRQHWKQLRDVPVHKIERRDVAARVAEIELSNGRRAAGYARTVLSSLFSWAVREGLADANPVIGTNAPVEKRRARVLSDVELAQVWRACGDDDYGRIVKLLMLTGQRRGEVAGMRWSELDLGRAVWRLPKERVKNGRPHQVPLAPMALAIVESAPRADGRDLLFGHGPNGFNGWGRAKLALDARLPEMETWTVHDLRRSFATGLANLGVLPHVIEAALNHVSGYKSGVAGIYNWSPYEREVHAAMLLWAEHLRSAIDGRERKVIALGQR